MSAIQDHMMFVRSGHLVKATMDELMRVIEKYITRVLAQKRISIFRKQASLQKKDNIGNSLQTALKFLDVGSQGIVPTRTLILETVKNGWCAVYLNEIGGLAGWSGLGYKLTQELHTESVFFFVQKHTLRRDKDGDLLGQWGVFQFMVFQGGRMKRLVELINDGRWDFGTQGEPLPFEDVQKYKFPKKKDRFTAEMVVCYLGELGFFPFDDAFYVVDTNHPARGIEVVIHEYPKYEPKFSFTPIEEIRKKDGPFEHF